MIHNPEDYEPDLDDLTRGQLRELGMPGVVADVLDGWLCSRRRRGTANIDGASPRTLMVGAFLDALAAEGYRVEPILGPSFVELIPAATD